MHLTAGVLLALVASQPALGQGTQGERAAAFKKLIDCRSLADTAQRLACYDRETAALDAAETRREIVVLDRAQVTKTQRTLFGLPLPNLKIFGDDSSEAQKEITTTIKRAWTHSNGKWAFELADGAHWAQTDSRELVFEPEAGQPIRIRRAAVGSYMANIDRQTAIRVERIR
jgi:hypothetical protein